MGLVILLLFILLLAAAGALGFVVKVALGLALGLILTAFFGVWYVKRRVRRALYGTGRRSGPQWRRLSGSRVEVLDRRDRPQG